MSCLTYITGIITVNPAGRTQPEKKYILDTVLSHLPLVTGSEENMNVYVTQKNGFNSSSKYDEFGHRSNLGNGNYRAGRRYFEMQEEYIVIVDAVLGGRQFETTLKEFNKWMCRLSKRMFVDDALVKISDLDKNVVLQNTNDVYGAMFEPHAWGDTSRKPNWCEYLMYNYKDIGDKLK